MAPSPAALDRVRALMAGGRRVLLGLAGPPAAGKSTLAEALVAHFDPQSTGLAVLVPMDGFHLANEELARLGRADRKGAPDTFDADGYVSLVRRLRAADPDETVYAPRFDRDAEQAVAGAIAVPSAARLVVTEGNYLLLDEAPWSRLPALFDETWYVALDDGTRLDRLVRRHVRFGRTPEAAREWVERSDQANARVIEAARHRADYVYPAR